jgi:ribulose-phosphate 3-epimerase
MSRRQKLIELHQAAPQVLPSLLQCDFGNLQVEVEQLSAAGVQALHLDVMDGQFVPNLTYGMPIVAGLRGLTRMPLDVHLMIERPDRYVEQFFEAGADVITIHVETLDDPAPTLAKIRELGAAAGLALNPATPLEAVTPFLNDCDLILVMSVNAGFGGQTFNSVALDKLSTLRSIKPDSLVLEIDGGVNSDTIAPCVQAGADLLVVGSAIFQQDDYQTALDQLHTLLS